MGRAEDYIPRMVRTGIACAAIFAFGLLAASAAEEENLLKNADFGIWEKGKPTPKYWYLEPGPTIAVSKTDGLQVQVKAAGKGDGRICNSFDMESQATYILTAQIKGSVDKIGYLQIEFLDGGNELKSMARLNSEKNAAEWTDVTVKIATKEAKRFSVMCRWEQTDRTTGQSAWFRNLKLLMVGENAVGGKRKAP